MLLSPQPLVREMGEPDHVGLFVLKFPISFYTPGITMKSGSDRLPRRTGLCVLFKADQLLIICVGPWTKWWITRRISSIWLEDSEGWWRWCIWSRCQGESRSARWCGGDGIGCGRNAISDVRVRMIMCGSSA